MIKINTINRQIERIYLSQYTKNRVSCIISQYTALDCGQLFVAFSWSVDPSLTLSFLWCCRMNVINIMNLHWYCLGKKWSQFSYCIGFLDKVLVRQSFILAVEGLQALGVAILPRSRLRQNGRHFPDDIFKWNFLNENAWISIEISLTFVPRGPINNIPALVQIMAWRRPGDKPLSA